MSCIEGEHPSVVLSRTFLPKLPSSDVCPAACAHDSAPPGPHTWVGGNRVSRPGPRDAPDGFDGVRFTVTSKPRLAESIKTGKLEGGQ